jgi:superfamily I DNA/RNA helicase
VNPYEAARLEAGRVREELASKGVDLNVEGFALVVAACKELGVGLRQVSPGFPLLKSADATILVARKFTFVRNDLPDEVKAFLVAHELGHLRLHPATLGTIEVSAAALNDEVETTGANSVEGYGARERLELQANVFAREFLLPRRRAREAFLAEGRGATNLAKAYALPLELVRQQLLDGVLLPEVERQAKTYRLPDSPTAAQQPAVDSDAPVSLVEAGPGTGKTTTLLLRLRRLIAAGVAPETIVILTFSNKAARELVERARAGNIPGADRIWIGTFHAFGLEFLRKFGYLRGLASRFPVLDRLAALAMLEQEAPLPGLEHYDPLSNSSYWLASVVDAIRRSKDEFFDAQCFEEAVATDVKSGIGDAGKLQDAASVFRRYEALLATKGAVDLTDLLCITVQLIQEGDPAVHRYLQGIQHLMVDEYQDVNRTSALLVKGLAHSCKTVWVVGDANQAIYAFMGASSSNLESFQADFPSAVSIPLALNHRSSQEVVDAFGTVARRNPAGRATALLVSQAGPAGHGSRHVRTSDEAEQARALAWRIQELSGAGVALAEQAVVTYQNAVASDVAQRLERLGIPVLFLGNIFERDEVKDLICLLQLATDESGSLLVRSWHAPCLAMSADCSNLLLRQSQEQKLSWREVSGEGLSEADVAAWRTLVRLCSLIEANQLPWDALCAILLEDGQWLRDLASNSSQAGANALMAIWQFVYFARMPDGTGRLATIKNLPQSIRDRIRLGEDRAMRQVPPEAEGMNAVRILTAHGSKGLEFDAVHLVDVKASTYAPTKKPGANPHVPSEVLADAKLLEIHQNERHNLLYVAMSRPRQYLTVYTDVAQPLPESLNGLLADLDGPWERSVPPSPSEALTVVETVVPLETYLEFDRCAQKALLSSRGGKWQREGMKLHRAVELAIRRAVGELATNPELLEGDRWQSSVASAISHFKLDELGSTDLIKERVEQHVLRGRALLAEGGTVSAPTTLAMGPLKVELKPDQVVELNGVKTLRFIRPNEQSLKSLKQPLAALLDAHKKAGGAPMNIQMAALSDGQPKPVGTVRGETPAKYAAKAKELCSGDYSRTAESARVCHSCAYLFPCGKRPADEDC